MQNGGNRKFQEYLSQYELQDVKDIKVKYNTRAADYYRRRNLAQAMGDEFTEEAPTIDQGRTMLDGRRLDINGEPIELTEEEKQKLTDEQRALDEHSRMTNEAMKNANAGPAAAPYSMGSLFGIVQSTLQSTVKAAQDTAASL